MSAIYPACFARFYDLIYSSILTGIDSEYYLGKARETKGPVLEVGTGTGRFFIEALKSGADIYGIDISPSMIDILKGKIEPLHHSRVSIQDIINFNLEKKFDLIIAPFRVLMHLKNISDQILALEHVYDQLNNGGQFIFDLFVPNPQIIANGLNEIVDFEGEYQPGEKIKRIVSARYDLVNQINHLTMRFEWTEQGELYSGTWNTTMRLFFRYELEHLLSRSKFKETHIYGDFRESQLNEGSKEFVVVCRK
jgi:SAM-dependent methyltransferase